MRSAELHSAEFCPRNTLKTHEIRKLIFVSFRLFSGPEKMIFAVFVVFSSRFVADQKSSQDATNLAYSSAEWSHFSDLPMRNIFV